MEQIRYGSRLSGGQVTVPPSKSAAIRALLCALLTNGKCILRGMEESEDIQATVCAVQALGALIDWDKKQRTVTVNTQTEFVHGGTIHCGESGSLLRFIIPIAAAIGGNWRFTGQGRLPQRPLGVYAELLPTHGVAFRSGGGLPLEIEGKLTPGFFALPGNISSQFITGLLFALPLLKADSEIRLTSPLESQGYVDMTLDILHNFGVRLYATPTGWIVPGNQSYTAKEYKVEGDWSQAAFFLNLAALSPDGAQIRIAGLTKDSLQGDRACVQVFGRFGLDTWWEDDILVTQNRRASEPFGGLTGLVMDVSQITDMVPAASVCAALSQGETRFLNAGRLRLKESDRLAAMAGAITALGGKAMDEGDALVVKGVKCLDGGLAQGCNDHRVLMALAGAGLRSVKPVCVTDPWSIKKTYPNFYEELKKLGGEADVIKLG